MSGRAALVSPPWPWRPGSDAAVEHGRHDRPQWRASLDYVHALGLLILCRLLFGGFRGRGFGDRRGHWEKWQAMTPEEREALSQRWQGCGRSRGQMSGPESRSSCRQEPGSSTVVDFTRCEGKADCVRVCPEGSLSTATIEPVTTPACRAEPVQIARAWDAGRLYAQVRRLSHLRPVRHRLPRAGHLFTPQGRLRSVRDAPGKF